MQICIIYNYDDHNNDVWKHTFYHKNESVMFGIDDYNFITEIKYYKSNFH